MNITNDHLLSEKNVNELIEHCEKKKVFIKNDFLNIYAALVKSNYPYHLKNGPYLSGKDLTAKIIKLLDELPEDYKKRNFLKLRKEFSAYSGVKRIDSLLPLWIRRNCFPFVFIRFLSLLKDTDDIKQRECFISLIKSAEFFTSFNHTIFKPILTLEKLLVPSIAYFVGFSFGDGGTVYKKLFKITDGSSKKIELNYSKIFLIKLSKLIKNKFSLKCRVFKEGNKYRLYLINKWFCYFLNFFFGLPLQKKKGFLRRPLIFDLTNKENLIKVFWRGFFDADSSIRHGINLEIADKNLLFDCQFDLKKYSIISKIKEREKLVNGKLYKEYILTIPSSNRGLFAKNIGFSHPRMQREFIRNLKNQIGINNLKKSWALDF